MYYLSSIIFNNEVTLISWTLKVTINKVPYWPLAMLTLWDSFPCCKAFTFKPLPFHLSTIFCLKQVPLLSLNCTICLGPDSPYETICFLNRSHTIYLNFTIVVVNPKFLFNMGVLLYFKTKSFNQILFSYILATVETEVGYKQQIPPPKYTLHLVTFHLPLWRFFQCQFGHICQD